MSLQFIYDDGQNNLVDEYGRPTLDDMDVDDALPLESIFDLDRYQSFAAVRNQSTNSVSKDQGRPKSRIARRKNSKSRRYRMYNEKDKQAFFTIWNERPGDSISAIARGLGIHPRTAQKWVKKFKESSGEDIPTFGVRGRVRESSLEDVHRSHIYEVIDKDPSINLDSMMLDLSNSFSDLNISKSTLYRFMTNECVLSFKLARLESVDRNSPEKLTQRFQFANRVLGSDIDFCNNCVFIDEAGFNINMKRSGGWSKKGTTPVVKTPQTRSENKTILGAICYDGVVMMSLRIPKMIENNKKRKLEGTSAARLTTGTVTGHYKQFLMDTMDVLDKHPQWKKCYLVMDNASIHKNASIPRIISSRGYRYLYLPPFSPELNPIEQFWHMVKSQLKRERLLAKETLTSRIQEAAKLIPVDNIQHSIAYSKEQLSKCLEMHPL